MRAGRDLIVHATFGIPTVAPPTDRDGTGLGGRGQPSDSIQARITDAIDLRNAGSARASLELLEKLRREEWHLAPPRVRSRLLAAIGFAHCAIGNQSAAESEFRTAFAVDPDRPGASALLAFAHKLAGDDGEAFTTAKKALVEDPTSEQAAVLLPMVAPLEWSLSEVEALIPDASRRKVDVLLGLIAAARVRNNRGTARDLAEKAHARAPDDWRCCAALAEELLGPVFEQEAIALTKAVPSTLAEEFHRGLGLVRKAWALVRGRDQAAGAVEIAANLAAALVVSGDEDGAELVISEGLRLRPDNHTLLRRRVIGLASRNDWAGVRTAISAIPDADREPTDRVLDAKAALICGDIPGARSIAAQMLEELPTGTRGYQLAEAIALEAALASGEGITAVVAALDASPDSIILRSAAVDTAQTDTSLRERILRDLTRLASMATDARDRGIAADILAVLGEHSLAADLFAALDAPLDRDTLVLSGRLRALILADRRQEAREVFEKMAPGLRLQKPYLELGIFLYDRIGMLPRAIRLAEQHLQNEPEDLRVRLAWINLSERCRRSERVREWLSGVPATVAGGARELMALAHLIDRYLADPKCLRIGYRALRLGYHDSSIHAAYAFGLFMPGRAAACHPSSPQQVGLDTAVTLERLDSTSELVRLIETEADPRLERDEVTASDSFAVRLLGLKVGDEIRTPSLDGEQRGFRVTRIEDKFHFAQRRCLSEFHRRFPDSQAFSTFNVDHDQIEAVLRVVRRRSEFMKEVIGRYKNGDMPLAFVAQISGSNIYDTWEGICAYPETSILCSRGDEVEADKAASDIESAEICVLDPLVPYAAVRLGIDGLLRKSLPRLAVTQSTLDMLRDLVGERRDEHLGRRGTLSWEGDHCVFREMSDVESQVRIDTAERALAFAERCELVPAEAQIRITGNAAAVYRFLPPAFLDAARSAQSMGRMLLSDDLPLRSLAAAETGVRGIWTQAALQHGTARNAITAEEYSGAVARLARARYTYVRVCASDILFQFRIAGWYESDLACELLRRLAMPGNESSSVVRVCVELLLSAMQEVSGDARFENLAVTVARHFKEAQPTAALERLNAVLMESERILRSHAWALNRGIWLQTTFLVNPETIELDIRRSVTPKVRRIRDALIKGLRASNRAGQSIWRSYTSPVLSSQMPTPVDPQLS